MRATFKAALAGAFVSMLVLVPPAHATFPGNPGLIAYHAIRSGNVDIYTSTGNGSGTDTRLTTAAGDDVIPNWSPDGTKIAFTSIRDGNYEIYTMNANGSGQTRITTNPADDVQAAWSADGTKLAFVSNRDGNYEIYTMNSNGTGVVRLTTNTANDSQPNWSPDGTKIAFESNRTGNFDVYTMNIDGTSQVDLTNNAATDEMPNWTPGASKIYFDSNRSGQFEIESMNSDGTNVTQATSNASTVDQEPAPAPGGLVSYVWQSNANGPDVDIWSSGFFGPADINNNSTDEGSPDWQALNRSYARPKGATPLRLSLVPANKLCGASGSHTGFAFHQGSINSNACWEPKPESSYLTVGTLDYNGQAANSVGSVRIDVKQNPTADGAIAVSYTDVRCAGTSGGCSSGALNDYTDDLYFDSTWRITDKGNGPIGFGPSVNATVDELLLRFSVPCASTALTSIGSTCSTNTTINSLLGSSAIVANRRAVWQLVGGINLWDGGADGVGQTMGDDTLFAVGGLFFP